MSVKAIPRNPIQHSFFRWYRKNRTRFLIPFRISKISADYVKMYFQNYPDCLSVSLSRNAIGVYVEWQGEPWDELIDYDASPFPTSGGYKCKQCVYENGDSATLFSSREEMWLDHVFNPFLNWVNTVLAPARWLRISSVGDGGATWAKVIRDEEHLRKKDGMLIQLQKLKKLDGQPAFHAYEGGQDVILSWLVPLKSEQS
jgi:hypothetical protein